MKMATRDCTVNIAIDTIRIGKQAIIFANTKASAEKAAEDIAKALEKEKLLKQEEEKLLKSLADKIEKALQRPTKQCRRLASCVKKGIAFHHAGLANKQRELIEESFKKGVVKAIASTPTLAAGVDLPAFRVIIKSLKRFGSNGMQNIPVLEFMQMAGRAGRPSYDCHGEAIAIAKTSIEKESIVEGYIYGEAEDIISKLAARPILRASVLSLVASEIEKTKEGILGFFMSSLWAKQYKNDEIISMQIAEAISELESYGFISEKKGSKEKKSKRQSPGYEAEAVYETKNGYKTKNSYEAQKAANWQKKSSGLAAYEADSMFVSASSLSASSHGRKNAGNKERADEKEKTTGCADSKEKRKVYATQLGKRVSELYLDPESAHKLLKGIKNAEELATKGLLEKGKPENKSGFIFNILFLIATLRELRPLLRPKQKELDELELKLLSRELFIENSSYFEDELAMLKTALMLESWINEAGEEEIMEQYGIRPGELKAKLDIADWLLYAAYELSKLIFAKSTAKEIHKLRERLSYGIKEELLSLVKLKGIGKQRARKLYNSNLKTIGSLKKAPLISIAQAIGSRKLAENIKKELGQEIKKISSLKRKGQKGLV